MFNTYGVEELIFALLQSFNPAGVVVYRGSLWQKPNKIMNIKEDGADKRFTG